ncbi:hypothetical protein AMK13_15300 [Streptomyces sp. CB02056]|nr:hypothetical protein AMK13_15300 [Streptomyces sp. CB02056]
MADGSRPTTASAPAGSSPTEAAPAARSSRASSAGRAQRTRTSVRACSARKSAVERSATSRPRPMTTRWSAVRAVSLIRCEESRTVRPSAARSRRRVRIHWTPSGSSPLTGSSSSRTGGSPSRAAAMPRRCFMPSEKRPARRRAAVARPVSSSTSRTRRGPMPLVTARPSRWWRAERAGWTAPASSSAPTSRSGWRSEAYGRPLTVARPAVGASRPRIIRRVVDLPEPFGPRKPVTRPGRTVKVSPSTARVPP